VRRCRRIGPVEIGIEKAIAREAVGCCAVGEEIDVLRADDMRELKRGLSVAMCLRLIWR
jgi:hypothetical protein